MDLTEKQKDKLKLLEDSLGMHGSAQNLKGEEVNTVVCAALRREERLQYTFMVLYQVIVLVLAFVVLALLLFAAVRIVKANAFEAIISAAGALVSGAAATFLLAQRRDARDAHVAALKALENRGC